MQQANASADATATEQAPRHHITIGDYAVTDTGGELVTFGLGSCLGVALVDAHAGVAGLAHVKRPSASGECATDDAVFADSGISVLYSEMQSCGATSRHTVAKLAGGINMGAAASVVGSGIGERNITQAETTLASLDIPVASRDVGGETVRSVYVDGASGTVTIETACDERYML